MMLNARWFKRAHWGQRAARRYFYDEYWAQSLEWRRRGRVASSRAPDLVIGSDNALSGLVVAAKPGDSLRAKVILDWDWNSRFPSAGGRLERAQRVEGRPLGAARHEKCSTRS